MFTVERERAAQRAQEGFERGQRVRPTADVIAATGYRESSRLVVSKMRRDSLPALCSGCYGKLKAAGRRRTWEETTRMRAGELYARGQETSSSLCLGCVEPAD